MQIINENIHRIKESFTFEIMYSMVLGTKDLIQKGITDPNEISQKLLEYLREEKNG